MARRVKACDFVELNAVTFYNELDVPEGRPEELEVYFGVVDFLKRETCFYCTVKKIIYFRCV